MGTGTKIVTQAGKGMGTSNFSNAGMGVGTIVPLSIVIPCLKNLQWS
jgi:hypothetical protein